MRAPGPPAAVVAVAPPEPGRRRLAPLLRLAVSGALIYAILQGVEIGEVLRAASGTDPRILFLAFLLNFVGYVLTACRWSTLLRACGIRAPLRYLAESCMVAMFFNNFLPSTVGGDAVRAYDSWRLGRSRAGAVAVILIDRLLGMLVMLLLAGGTLLLSAPTLGLDLPLLRWWVAGMAAAGVALTWMLFLPPGWLTEGVGRLRRPLPAMLRRLLDRLHEAFRAFQGRGDALARALAFSLVLQFNVILQYYLVARALGLPIPFLLFLVLIPVALLVMSLPVSINAIGIREGIFAFLFGLVGVASATAVAFAWLMYAIILVHGLLGGLVYAARRDGISTPEGLPASAS